MKVNFFLFTSFDSSRHSSSSSGTESEAGTVSSSWLRRSRMRTTWLWFVTTTGVYRPLAVCPVRRQAVGDIKETLNHLTSLQGLKKLTAPSCLQKGIISCQKLTGFNKLKGSYREVNYVRIRLQIKLLPGQRGTHFNTQSLANRQGGFWEIWLISYLLNNLSLKIQDLTQTELMS